MHPTYIFTGLVALASSANAAVLPRNDPYVGDLRTFGQVDCSADNQGVGTFTQSMTGICNQWPEAFSSIYVHLTDGWVFHAYTNSNCSDNGNFIQGSVPKDGYPVICNNSPTQWVAYTVDRLPPSSPSDGSPSEGSPPTSTPTPLTPPTPPHGPPHGGPPFGPPFGGSTQNSTS
ncbi:uncharacterized protein F4807DRAFT_23810 [Annulohypoxylon truncatum]|uniref:uncharacterized protein n=1 Tax=Annulohypoxylon truncatum TaxID=327061 RepID=UPI00200722F2|nr:uncharacterized protein F4807DRAFT_23810 [Annulohypoxylon truncatum]KAI1215162.1 hypothetical protein F4807DRAFT_23810 [Annulohypoxylon truncatum]